MDKGILNNKLNVGLNGLTKKVPAAQTTAAPKAPAAGTFANDSMSISAKSGAESANGNDATQAAGRRLAKCYNVDASVFSHNLAADSLGQLCADSSQGTRRLANSAGTDAHVNALANKIQADPSFALLHETARKMSERYAG
ncbi:MAG TPA: hypothetical protein V6D47_11615 [Oscillatoriaceae cyanobacterium]